MGCRLTLCRESSAVNICAVKMGRTLRNLLGRRLPPRRSLEFGQQFRLALEGFVEMGLFYVAVAADLFGDGGQIHRQAMLIVIHSGKDQVDQGFVVGNESAFLPALGATPEDVEWEYLVAQA